MRAAANQLVAMGGCAERRAAGSSGQMILAVLMLLPCRVVVAPNSAAQVTFHPPVHVGESNWSHFWMPSSLFKGVNEDVLMAVDMAGDGKPCPPPGHPQNCSALYRSRDSGGSWEQIYGNIPGMALPIPGQPGSGRVRAYNFDSKASTTSSSYEVFSAMWLDTASSGVQRVGAESIMVPLTGFPPLAGPPAMSGNVVRLGNSSTLIGTMYGRLKQSSKGCHPFEGKGAPPWPGCDSNFYAASTDEGQSWQYRSHLNWLPGMSPKAEGITESSITQLQDGRLLSIVRLNSNLPMYKVYSTDEARTWSELEETKTWAVYPQLRTLPNGAVVLASGRPGLGFWVSAEGDGSSWTYYNLCAEHNRLYPDPLYHYQQTELDVRNVSSPGTWPPQTKAYIGMVLLGCGGGGGGGSECDLLLSYDRLANGNSGPPGPWGSVDAVFAMRVSVTV